MKKWQISCSLKKKQFETYFRIKLKQDPRYLLLNQDISSALFSAPNPVCVLRQFLLLTNDSFGAASLAVSIAASFWFSVKTASTE